MSAIEPTGSQGRLPARGSLIELHTLRRLLLMAGSTYLLWWFAVEALLPGSYNPLGTRLAVVAYFYAVFAASFVRGIKADGIDLALNGGVWLLTAHYYYLVHRNPGAMPWAVGAYVVAIAAGATLRSRRAQLAYSALTVGLAVPAAMADPVLLRSIFLPGLATMVLLSNFTWHTRSLLEAERAERAIANARRAAAEASVAAREEFIAIASHELYTPLTALQLTIQSLANKLGRPDVEISREKIIERLDRCRRDVGRLVRLVDELLNTSRSPPGTPSLRFEPVRLGDLVEEVASALRSGATNDRTPIQVSGDLAVELTCDRLRIEQVVMNLLRNALKFGAGKPVRVSVERTEKGARIAVADQGIGIAPADQARIFERFERAVSNVHYGGMGLGLYVVKQIVDAHGGTVRVDSQAGHGATFVVDLPGFPVARGSETLAAPPPAPP